MSFEDVMASVMRWATATDALAALGAELAVQQPGVTAPPEIVRALGEVSAAAGIGDVGELPAPQQAMVLALIGCCVHQASDLLDHPDRAPGWTFTDPAILDGWGRGSAMVPALIAAAHPDLARGHTPFSMLVPASACWPWPRRAAGPERPSSALTRGTRRSRRARANVDEAGLAGRIELRRGRLTELDDVDTYDGAMDPDLLPLRR